MYKPSDFHTSHVRNIILDIGIPWKFDPPLLDFSGVPNATVYGRFYKPDLRRRVRTTLFSFATTNKLYDPDLYSSDPLESSNSGTET